MNIKAVYALILLLTLHAHECWTLSNTTSVNVAAASPTESLLNDNQSLNGSNSEEHEKCSLIREQSDPCAYVRKNCEQESLIPYLHIYYCDIQTNAGGFFFVLAMLVLLAFLFIFIGTAAGDFFCPNLSTVSSLLRLSENVTGLTFLALGNGAPDLFTTFTAMQKRNYNLALGELMGAATFITTVIVGTIAIMTGFRVTRRPFIRDVLFFLGAVVVLLITLSDGKITKGEAILLVCYYIFYVVTVVIGRFLHQRKKQRRLLDYQEELERRQLLQEEGGENALIEEADQRLRIEVDLKSQFSSSHAKHLHDDFHMFPELFMHHQPTEDQYGTGFVKYKSIIGSRSRRPTISARQEIGTSLFSTTSLRSGLFSKQSPAPTPVANESQTESSPWKVIGPDRAAASALGKESVAFVRDSYRRSHFNMEHSDLLENIHGPSTSDESAFMLDHFITHPSSVSHSAAQSETPSEPLNPTKLGGQERRSYTHPNFSFVHEEIPRIFGRLPYVKLWYPQVKSAFLVLCPAVSSWPWKSWPERIVSIIAAPATLLLTLTVPVIDAGKDGDTDRMRKVEKEILLSRFSQDTESPINATAESVSRPPPQLSQPSQFFSESIDRYLLYTYPLWNRWLFVTQCLIVPPFIVIAGGFLSLLSFILALMIGVVLSGTIYYTTSEQKRPFGYHFLCLTGFPTAVLWIYLIANEVVSLLLSLGLMLDISDAVLGLTIFAVGNSLADFVANVTVARLGYPNMAIAACFGGPMLNILLGIGCSSLYFTIAQQENYELQVTPTLITSAIGLLTSLVVSLIMIPWFGWQGSKMYGVVLICIYLTTMLVNVITEVFRP